MCLVIDFRNEKIGQSGNKYWRVESMQDAVDVFGREKVVAAFDKDFGFGFDELLASGNCLCPINSEKLMDGYKHLGDWKIDYEDFQP